MTRIKYRHLENKHNLNTPREIVPFLQRVLKPQSVVDVGCGIGTFLSVFKEIGVKTIVGIDGNWVDKELLLKYLSKDEYIEADLEKPFRIEKKFDLAISLEVAEHIKEEFSDRFVESLVLLSDVIVFSAAIPFQSGQNHVNEQWMEYWMPKFKKHGFEFHDILRPVFWNNSKIDVFYKQNIFLILKTGYNADSIYNNCDISSSNMYNIVHPDLFTYKAKMLDEILLGKSGFKLYFWLLAKKIIRAFGLIA